MLDVLIIGGGPAGATTAILLAEAGWSVGLIEKKTFPRKKVCGEFISVTSLPLLQKLGLAEFYHVNGGSEIQKIGLYSGEIIVTANMPLAHSASTQWGRALGREHLDAELLNTAKLKGVQIWQPYEAMSLQHINGMFVCSVKKETEITEIVVPLVVVANGSWEKKLGQLDIKIHKPTDLLAFKAHFRNANLAGNLMPLLAFPGGYGGLVHSSHQKVTLSCCIRRDFLHDLRLKQPGMQAAEVVFQYILTHCRGVREALANAVRDGKWLSAGPIQPGIRSCYKEGIFFVGNAAGEAHPIVAEGISMAMQSAWLLSQIFIRFNVKSKGNKNLNDVGSYYTKQWRKHFVNRIYASAFFSQLAMMNPWARSFLLPIIKRFPVILTLGAKFSGKIQQIVPIDKNY